MKNLNISVLLIFLFFVTLTGCSKTEEQGNKTETKTESNITEQKNIDPMTTNNETKTESTEKDSVTTDNNDKKSDGDIVKMETNMGTIKIKLYTEKAPITTENFKKLVNKGFYDGVTFHRVIDGFMIQGGDPTGTGRGGSDEVIKDEFHPDLKHNKAGILSMAYTGPNTGTSQFFITLAPQPHLDNRHAVFGEVIEGMDVVKKIGKVKTGPGDKPVEDVIMTKVTVENN